MVGLKKQKINNKKPNEFLCWTFCIHGYKIRPYILRAWYNGSTSASQAEDEGSIPFARTKKINRRNRRFCFWIVGDGIEPDKAASAAQGSERSGVFSPHAVKGARRNHQEPRDWIDFGRELYIPFARTTLRLGEASGGCATRQTSRTGERVPHEVLTKCG